MATVPFLMNKQEIANPNTFTQGPLRLTSVFPVKEMGPHELLSGITYENDGCTFDFTSVDFAPLFPDPEDPEALQDCIRTAEKAFEEGLNWTESALGWGDSGGPLSLYTALKCRPGAIGGGDAASYDARVRRRLTRQESAYLEVQLDGHVSSVGTQVIVTGDTIDVAIGKLLDKADELTNPTLHTTPGIAMRLDLGNRLLALGIRLVVSSFYNYSFITGDLNIWGGEVNVTSVPQPEANYIMAIAERQYLLAVECEPFWADTSEL